MSSERDTGAWMIKTTLERGRAAFTFIPSAEGSLAAMPLPPLSGDALAQVHALMLLTLRSGDCRPLYAQAAEIARAEKRRLSPLSSDYWRWRARARRYRRGAK